MLQITIDEKPVSVPEGVNLIEAARIAGVEIPHYCYHVKLPVVGTCRMCLIEVDGVPKLQPACNTKVKEGMVVKTESERVKTLRKSVLEFLLINHPLDCPICDQAGECKLQEYYMAHDLVPSRFFEEKNHGKKAIELGPYVMLDQERCVLCTRCVRFLREVTKTNELYVEKRGEKSVIEPVPGKRLDNQYSANVCEICPVGALTNKKFRFRCRVWFLGRTKSICPGCAMGCNIEIHHHNGRIYRLVPRINDRVNGHWMCDEGRETYLEVGLENRLSHPMIKEGGRWMKVGLDAALKKIKDEVGTVDPGMILGVGSAGAVNEENFALKKFVENIGGEMPYYHKNEPVSPTSDDFLIKDDKNPNTRGVEDMGLKPIKGGRRYRAFFVIGDIREDQIKKFFFEQGRFVVRFATHFNAEKEFADILLPVGTFAETDGTYTNCDGRVQRVNAALQYPGDGMAVWGWGSKIAAVFGKKKPSYKRVGEVFLDMADSASAYRGLSYDKIGEYGVSLVTRDS